MTDLTRVDRIMLQIRAQLEKTRGAARRETKAETNISGGAIERLARQGTDDQPQWRRRLVRAVLLDELGADLVGDAELERISDEVWRLLEEQPEGRALLEAAATQLPLVRKAD